ncbi:FMN-dependent NADH-azoreductase [Granulicella rosea]|uniref:FMN dependent NADH:quinone oxidoreductase n=1 Tax=Granulicella rosea TaxID=474952 RepID=A0A239DR39_9BACT|nr:NAD(P)H-dependent oxidoreductase [Granulicella rosea]SNS34193.1 FMN-dependent NADH-azoreductase [Granulicella rosea]
MPTLLKIDASPRGEYSISRSLSAAFAAEWQKNNPEGTVVVRDLMKTTLPFVDLPWIAGAYTPAEAHSPEMHNALVISNELIAELFAADHIVISTPMYNFSTPAVLKAYIDHIVRFGVTFSASYEGLIKGKKVTLIIASGGVYTPGSHMESYDRETAYLKQIFGFIGLAENLEIVQAGGSNDVAQGKKTQAELVASFVPQVVAAAK